MKIEIETTTREPKEGDWVIIISPYDGSYGFEQTKQIVKESGHAEKVFYGENGSHCLLRDCRKLNVNFKF